MHVEDVIWDEYNVEHLAAHRVRPEEVEDTIWDNPRFEKRRGQQRYHVYGQTSGGRYLFIILDRVREAIFYVVTAREMTSSEKSYYKRKK